MQLIKITQLNKDGSIAFEALLPPEEAQVLLEVGLNVMLSQGYAAEDEEEDDEDPDLFEVDGSDTLQ